VHNHSALTLFGGEKKAYALRHWRRAIDLCSKELESNPSVADELVGYYSNIINAMLQSFVSFHLCTHKLIVTAP